MCITETYMINDANKLSEKASSVNGRVITYFKMAEPIHNGQTDWTSKYSYLYATEIFLTFFEEYWIAISLIFVLQSMMVKIFQKTSEDTGA